MTHSRYSNQTGGFAGIYVAASLIPKSFWGEKRYVLDGENGRYLPAGLLHVGFNFVFPDCSATAFLFHKVIGRTNSA